MKGQLILLLVFAIFSSTFAQNGTQPDDGSDIQPDPSEWDDKNSTTTTTPTNTTTTPTTPTTTTTTPTTTTTTEAPTTVAPPTGHYLYNITENNVTCIMLDGKLSFKVIYNVGENKTNISTVDVPKPSSAVNVNGTCSLESQYIEIAWGHLNSVNISFEQTKDHKSWHVSNFTSTIYLDPSVFINATDAGDVLTSIVVLVTTPSEIPVNHSLKCYSGQTFNNVTTTKENVPYQYPVELMVDGFQLQAFNHISHQSHFVEEVHCDADKIADVVPIAVGCALAGLVVLVLIAYIIGRRRRAAAYQSV